MARKLTVHGIELRPAWLGGYLGKIDGRFYRFALSKDGRRWEIRAPIFPGFGRKLDERDTLRDAVGAMLVASGKEPGG